MVGNNGLSPSSIRNIAVGVKRNVNGTGYPGKGVLAKLENNG